MKQTLLTGATLLALSTAPAVAGDWTGFYAGIGLGYLDVDTNLAGVSGDDLSYGVHAGYRYDFGDWVVGGELEYDWTDVGLTGPVAVDSVLRLKGTVGYDFGRTMLYLAVGTAEVDVAALGDDWGGFYGLGYAYAVSDRAVLSLEILDHDFDNINGSGINADATSFNFRASFNF